MPLVKSWCPWHTTITIFVASVIRSISFSVPQKGTKTTISVISVSAKSEIPHVFDQTNGWLGQSTRRPRCSNAPWMSKFSPEAPEFTEMSSILTYGCPQIRVPRFAIAFTIQNYQIGGFHGHGGTQNWMVFPGTSYEDGWFGGTPMT